MHAHVNGTRLWFDVDGPALVPDGPGMRTRPTVVLLHGGPGSFDHSYLKPDFGRLAEVAQVVYLDLRDHGRSARGDPRAWSFEQAADDVRAFCDAVGIERPVVLGHSLGGFVAMVYGGRHPGHAAGLALVSTTARFDLERMVEEFRRRWGDEVADVVARVYGGDRGSVSPEEWARCWRLFGPWVTGPEERGRTVLNPELNPVGLELMRSFDARAELGRVECPTLVCAGDLDPVTPQAVVAELADALPEGLARVEVLAGGGHFPWRDVPERFWPLLRSFVSGRAAD